MYHYFKQSMILASLLIVTFMVAGCSPVPVKSELDTPTSSKPAMDMKRAVVFTDSVMKSVKDPNLNGLDGTERAMLSEVARTLTNERFSYMRELVEASAALQSIPCIFDKQTGTCR